VHHSSHEGSDVAVWGKMEHCNTDSKTSHGGLMNLTLWHCTGNTHLEPRQHWHHGVREERHCALTIMHISIQSGSECKQIFFLLQIHLWLGNTDNANTIFGLVLLDVLGW